MVKRNFIVPINEFNRRKLTTLQHKLRVVLKCYTIREFCLNDDNSFTFKKSFRIKGVKKDCDNIITGSYIINNINDELLELSIII